jgi:transcriptional regulator with XRE-family HTH domain
MNHRIDGELILALRAERVIERKELAERSGISYSTLSQLETGKRMARTATVRKIARELDVPPASLILRPPFRLPSVPYPLGGENGGRPLVGV